MKLKRMIAATAALGISFAPLFAAEESKTEKAVETAVEKTKDAAVKTGKAVKGAAEKTGEATKEAAGKAKDMVTGKSEAKETGELSAEDKALLDHAAKSSAKLTAAQKTKLLEILNTGDDKALNDLPGVGMIKSGHIKKARPFKGVNDLILVEGIGEKTFDEIVVWAEGGFKGEVAPKKEAVKPDAPKADMKKGS
jgi:DNA uptake protein ComE-like DNA-binding protein